MEKRSIRMVINQNKSALSNGLIIESPPKNNPISNGIAVPNVENSIYDSVVLTTFHDITNWIRLSSLWPLLYGTSCCFIEFACLLGSRFDFDRYGLVPRSSPRQADLIITAGTVTMKMAPSLVRLYEQMPEPKYVIAMGACTITGGMFSTDSYSTVRGVDKLIPVDVYLPGCPPKPESIIDAVIKLRKKVSQETAQDKQNIKQEKRFFSIKHKLRTVPAIHTGEYISDILRRAPGATLTSNLQILSEEVLNNSLPEQKISRTDDWLVTRENIEIYTDYVISAKEVEDDKFSS
uniref:NAD(P)H-quinone oxidoreductase subunit K, chloroplastic n=1 Tax=Spirogyra maxima TaxID=3180 RepID=A0A191T4G1_SPIMX|nr:27 kDa subunit of NADH-ubiquinone oxidoreductase [Spirogyra maxima]ANI25277.1 27 kDa subunit of NADH-ubiquinone oxidoreductase [Spirogyra maxima]